MIELHNNELVFSFPELHQDAVCRIDFQRTLRLPDDNRKYPLPPGLGRFPLEHIEPYSSKLPTNWLARGGVFLPMYQAEALWINFSGQYPCAVKIAAGKINAVTGEAWSDGLVKKPQDYLVRPSQPWLDGFCVQKGLIRQFVAMPLGQGYTAEEQLTGAHEHGGLQIIVYPMKRERYEEIIKKSIGFDDFVDYFCASPAAPAAAMGLAAGGLMRQEIYKDDYGYAAWDTSVSNRCFVNILNSQQWQATTGKTVPNKPPTAKEYSKAGLPWFDYYDEFLAALDGAKKLAELDSVAAKAVKLGEKPLPENEVIQPTTVIQLGKNSTKVSDGDW
jgi:hypothetical protein